MILQPGVFELRDGRTVELRLVGPDDTDLLVEFHRRLSPRSRRLSLFGPAPELDRAAAQRLTGADPQRRIALVATAGAARPGGGLPPRVVGMAHFGIGAEGRAKFALAVEDEFQRVGLGTELLQRLAEAARRKGVRVLEGSSLPDNIPMLRLAQRQGARRIYQDPSEVVLAWPLERSAEPRSEPERTAG